MNEIDLWLVAVALAMDCLTVSLATGISSRRFLLRPMVAMALSFGLFQGGMFALGHWCTLAFVSYVQTLDHWIAFGLLVYLGGHMIYGDLIGGKEETQCEQISLSAILTMSVATSIDALAVGVSYACVDVAVQGVTFLYAALVIGLCSTVLSILGLGVGIQAGKRMNWHAEVLGGIVLILIGIKILWEHTM